MPRSCTRREAAPPRWHQRLFSTATSAQAFPTPQVSATERHRCSPPCPPPPQLAVRSHACGASAPQRRQRPLETPPDAVPIPFLRAACRSALGGPWLPLPRLAGGSGSGATPMPPRLHGGSCARSTAPHQQLPRRPSPSPNSRAAAAAPARFHKRRRLLAAFSTSDLRRQQRRRRAAHANASRPFRRAAPRGAPPRRRAGGADSFPSSTAAWPLPPPRAASKSVGGAAHVPSPPQFPAPKRARFLSAPR